ncbi:hypothetical protein ACF0H5_006078 [Mactra antiquata]
MLMLLLLSSICGSDTMITSMIIMGTKLIEDFHRINNHALHGNPSQKPENGQRSKGKITTAKVSKFGRVTGQKNMSSSFVDPFDPDALVNCDCSGKGDVEIKCPYCAKDITLEKANNKYLSEKNERKTTATTNKNGKCEFEEQTYCEIEEQTKLEMMKPTKSVAKTTM